MKKIMLLLFVFMLLCGCSNLKPLDINVSFNLDKTEIEDKEKIVDFIEGTNITRYFPDGKYDDESYEAELYKIKQYINTLPLAEAYLTGENDGKTEKANVHKDTELDLLFIEDEDLYDVFNINTSMPNKYKDNILEYTSAGWHFSYYIVGGGFDRLDFTNDEYILSAINNDNKFSLKYEDVRLEFNDIPIALTLYLEEGNTKKVYIKYVDIPYQKKELSTNNINMLSEGLSLAGIDETDLLIDYFSEYINDNKPSNSNIKGYKIKKIKPVNVFDNIKQSGIIVEIQ